jgi:hypothetical protein
MSEDILLRIIAQDDTKAAMASATASIDKMTDAEKKAAVATKEHSDQMQKLGNIAKGAALAGIAAVTAAIGDSIKETMDYTKSVRDLAQNLAITTEETSRIIQTADDFTVSQEAVTAALQMSVKKGMAPNIETLAKMADVYNSLSDPTERAAKLTEVFGRNWTALTPMLKEGGQAIREAAAAQDDALIVTEAQSKAVRDLEIALDNMGDKVLALKLKVGNALIPTVEQSVNVFEKFVNIVTGSEAPIERMIREREYLISLTGRESDEVKGITRDIEEYSRELTNISAQEKERARLLAMASSETKSSVLYTREWSDVLQSAGGLIAVWNEGQKKYTEESAAFVTQVNANQAAVDALRSAANNTVTSIDSMAQSLVGATKTQATTALAQSALSTIQEAGMTGRLSPDQVIAASNAVMKQYGLATPATLAMAAAQEAVNKSFLDANMSTPTYIDAIGKIPGIADDGKVTWADLNEIGLKPVNSSIKELTEYSQTLRETGITPLTGEIKTLVTDGLTKVAELKTNWQTSMATMKFEGFNFTDAMIAKFKEIPSTIPVNIAISVTGDKDAQDAVARARSKGLLP